MYRVRDKFGVMDDFQKEVDGVGEDFRVRDG